RDLLKAGSDHQKVELLFSKMLMSIAQGEVDRAYQVLEETRSWVEQNDAVAKGTLYTVIFNQGVVALRRGETDNCVMCRGESSCTLPIAPGAVHSNTAGSRRAIRHCTEYLEQFPDDLGVRWILNLAHMTLGEYPEKVDPRYVISLDRFLHSE